MSAERVVVTGANGFIGRGVLKGLHAHGIPVLGTVRLLQGGDEEAKNMDLVPVGDLGPETNWEGVLTNAKAVIHLAGLAHILTETSPDLLAAYRLVNVAGTERLARSAARLGVKRFIYLSSIGVNGNTSSFIPATEGDQPAPHNAYARSKWEAEQILQGIGRDTGMEIVIVRPPLVYGPGVKANFLALMRLVDRGVVLPFGKVDNLRSLLGLDNLVDFLCLCLDHPKAAGQTFLVADGEDVSTPDLIRTIAAAMGKPARLLPVPPRLLWLAGRLTGRSETLNKVCGSLRLDISKARQMLGWKPIIGLSDGIENTVRWYRQSVQH
jgi:nucleoside-diphosphate-sugar epimerase